MFTAALMVGVFLLPVAGGLAFYPQEVPGLCLDATSGVIEQCKANVRQTDINGDGAVDLVFGREVAFQREGLFPREARVNLLPSNKAEWLDVWKTDVYLRSARGLRVLRWSGSEWTVVLEQSVAWPVVQENVPGTGPATPQKPPVAQHSRFLHDLDEDGAPEVVLASEDGLHVYRTKDGGCVEAGTLPLLPPLRSQAAARPVLWPPERRLLDFPAQQMSCRLLIEPHRVSVLTRETARDGRVRYHSVSFKVTCNDAGFFETDALPVAEQASEWLPAHLAPYRLNQDDTMDLAGAILESSRARALSVSLFGVAVSIDAGKSITVRRGEGIRPGAGCIDFDSDGNLDLVTESSGILEGGMRESVLQWFSHSGVDHTIRVYRQAGGAFSAKPVLEHRISLHMESPPFFEDGLFQRYERGALTSLSGDYNGDGYRDLLVQDRPGRLAVYLAAGYAFPDIPDAVLPAEAQCRFHAFDVNGDGRSDVVMQWTPTGTAEPFERCRVYFSREEAP